ncbi:hypothetical protein IV203_033349 [Nitzschia inconspicua]|uniref:Uncharacterized protein n=1 Tax=Nitzschia inconspicua TaxID=303405 RepID=A0A9K3KLE7_9STRA|nr:hypothetical protein IV203_033349 [Nitzschia inconspicua]
MILTVNNNSVYSTADLIGGDVGSKAGLLALVSRQKLCNVTSESEAARRYNGQLSKTNKMVFGTVLSVDTAVNPTTNRSTTTVVLQNMTFGGGVTTRKSLNVRSVHAAVAPEEEEKISSLRPPNHPTSPLEPTMMTTPLEPILTILQLLLQVQFCGQ